MRAEGQVRGAMSLLGKSCTEHSALDGKDPEPPELIANVRKQPEWSHE